MTTGNLTRANKVIDRCNTLAGFSESRDGSTLRTFLSAPMRDCHREIASWLEPLGVSVTIDAAGNLCGFYGADPKAARVLIGSHLDTVPNAGKYDGVLGVVLAVSLLEALEGRKLPFGIEVVGFSDEEGVRFGVPFIGSRALVGRLDADLLSRQDAKGISVRQAIDDFGLNSELISQATLKDDVVCYLEFHIEQGPVLDDRGLPLGIVEAIAGQSRLELNFLGRANHAGTTPMHLRRDALAAAAEWIVIVEAEGRGIPNLVATVGSVEAKPGATNVIAGEARVTLDVRHASDRVRKGAVDNLLRQAEEIAAKRSVSVKAAVRLDQRAVPMDGLLMDQIEQAIRKISCDPYRMVSGAGHDAMILAEKVPAAMIFLRTPGGISHDPAEAVLVEDVARALDCGFYLLTQLAASPLLQTRTSRA